jgi:integrase/recombinase XerD
MQLSEAVEDFHLANYNLSPRTQEWYREKLAYFLSWCEPQSLTLESLRAAHIHRFLAHLQDTPGRSTGQPRSTYTVYGFAEVVKRFLNWCQDENYPLSKQSFGKIKMPKVEIKVIETFSYDQIKQMLAVCGREYNDELATRDRAIITLLTDTGIRASELVGLKIASLCMDAHDAHLKVLGKGKKEREVGIGSQTRYHLHRYIHRGRKAQAGEEHIFLGRAHQPMTINGLYQIIDRLGDWAHITGVRCSPHTFRHTYAMNFLRQGGDIYRLSRLLGHVTIEPTQIYLRAFKQEDARRGASVLDTLGS